VTLTVRRVTSSDATLLHAWRNDPVVRENSFSTDPIAWEDHQRWLAGRLASPSTAMFVLEDADGPVAQVRYERRADREAEVGITVAAEARGRGYGRAALVETLPAACAALGVDRVIALIKIENEPSRRAFEHAGFASAGTVIEHGSTCHRYVYRADESHA
jgi:UDP-2,4-diacetamido-2,4,6-trideoxy-beta-L-altropyranose hydrolase